MSSPRYIEDLTSDIRTSFSEDGIAANATNEERFAWRTTGCLARTVPIFDNQMLAQCVHFGFRMCEVSRPTKYFDEASSINFRRSVKLRYGRFEHNTAVCPAKMGLGTSQNFQR